MREMKAEEEEEKAGQVAEASLIATQKEGDRVCFKERSCWSVL